MNMFLVEEMETEGALLNLLYQHEVLDEQEVAEIRAINLSHKKNEKLLEFVLRTTSTQYETFVRALKESNPKHVHACLSLAGNIIYCNNRY